MADGTLLIEYECSLVLLHAMYTLGILFYSTLLDSTRLDSTLRQIAWLALLT